MTRLPLSGVVPPVITPLVQGQAVDKAALEKLLNFLIGGGVSGLFLMGSSGEGPWLDTTQRTTLISEAVRIVAGRVPVLVGALEPGTRRTLEQAHMAADLGASAVVITSPYYFDASAAAQIEHVQTVCRECPVPVMLYNIPPMTHNLIAAATVAAMLDFDNLIGIKDSAGDWQNFQALLALRQQRPDFQVWQGAERMAALAVRAGADGIVAGLANLVPAMFVSLFAQARSGDGAGGEDLQNQIADLWTLHTHGYWLACLKYAAACLGFGDGSLNAAGYALDAPAHRAIEATVAPYRLRQTE